MLTLTQAVRRLGKPSVSMPRFAVGRLGSAMRQARVSDFSPEQLGFLTYGRGVDTTRMRNELGFEPRFTTARRSPTSASRSESRCATTRRQEGRGPCLTRSTPTPRHRRPDHPDRHRRPSRPWHRPRPAVLGRAQPGRHVASRPPGRLLPKPAAKKPAPTARRPVPEDVPSQPSRAPATTPRPPSRPRSDTRSPASRSATGSRPSRAPPSRSSATSGSAAWPR